MICASVGTVLLHTPVRDGASKGKVERNFRTLKERWLYGLDLKQIQSLDEFNDIDQLAKITDEMNVEVVRARTLIHRKR